ncbi:MAG: hypothetical protein ABIG20_00985 [archaeon]
MTYEETFLTKALGNSPTIRVIDLLILGRGLDYSLSDIEEGAEVGWTTLHEVIPRLIEVGLIKHTRCVGRAKMYKLNERNPYAQLLIKLDQKLSNDNMNKIIAEQEELVMTVGK